MKKTIKVADLMNKVNDFLLNSDDDLKQAREQMGFFLETVLIETDNYKGYKYLSKDDMKLSTRGTSVGIHRDPVDVNEQFRDTDHTRTKYF